MFENIEGVLHIYIYVYIYIDVCIVYTNININSNISIYIYLYINIVYIHVESRKNTVQTNKQKQKNIYTFSQQLHNYHFLTPRVPRWKTSRRCVDLRPCHFAIQRDPGCSWKAGHRAGHRYKWSKTPGIHPPKINSWAT